MRRGVVSISCGTETIVLKWQATFMLVRKTTAHVAIDGYIAGSRIIGGLT